MCNDSSKLRQGKKRTMENSACPSGTCWYFRPRLMYSRSVYMHVHPCSLEFAKRGRGLGYHTDGCSLVMERSLLHSIASPEDVNTSVTKHSWKIDAPHFRLLNYKARVVENKKTGTIEEEERVTGGAPVTKHDQEVK